MAFSTHEMGTLRVVSVRFTDRGTRLAVELDDGRIISAPVAWYPRLEHGSPKERKSWRIIGQGSGIHWPELDEDISVENLLAGKRSQEQQSSIEQWLSERRKPGRR